MECRFQVAAAELASAFVPVSTHDLHRVFSLQFERTVKDNMLAESDLTDRSGEVARQARGMQCPSHHRDADNRGDDDERNPEPEEMTAAHPWLPFGTRIRVTLLETGRSVIVTITDRLPSHRRIVDLSVAAARELGIIRQGVAMVTLAPAS